MGKPKVVGIDSEYSGLVVVRVPLDPRPDEYWQQIFNGMPPGVSYSLSMHSVQVAGDSVEFRCSETEVERYHQHVKERVEGTNRYYAQEITPRLKAEEERLQREAEERKQRLEEAQSRLDALE
jgi:hypothetical protein